MYIDNQTIVDIFYKMLKSRLIEEQLVLLQQDGKIDAPLYLSIGQEATAAAVCALRDDDVIFAPHRNTTIAVAAQIDTSALIAEIAGLPNGLCKGVSGGLSIADNSTNFYGATALAGANFTKAVGAAMSFKIQQKDTCVVCFAGDGAAADGSFSEALNMASLYKLPVIFFIENNCYAGRSSVDKIHNVIDIAERAKGYGIPGLIADGNNPVEVYGSMKKAIEFATRSHAPVLIESKTYRLAGDTMADDQSYRTNDEISAWVEYDPIDHITDYMLENGIGIEEDLRMIRTRIEDEIKNAINKAFSVATIQASREPGHDNEWIV